jgi:hypothetical protein
VTGEIIALGLMVSLLVALGPWQGLYYRAYARLVQIIARCNVPR